MITGCACSAFTVSLQRRWTWFMVALALSGCWVLEGPAEISPPAVESLPTRTSTPSATPPAIPTWTATDIRRLATASPASPTASRPVEVTPSPAGQAVATSAPAGSPSATVSPAGAFSATATTAPPTATPASSATPHPTPAAPAGPWLYETTVAISTYGYELGFEATQPGDPVYPYPRLNFSMVGPPAPRTYHALVLENEYVSLTILPELGGRIYRWIDRSTGRQLLYENPVIKPTSWGYRGWWLAAGGIEWAFPVDEHGLNEWRPWSYSTGYTANGLSVTVSDVEDRTGMQVGATISLDADHSYVTIQPWARNDTGEAHQYQLWLNAMLTLGGNQVAGPTQLIIPASQVTVHSTGDGGLPGPGGAMGWPVHEGRDMSWYTNWSSYLGFFAPSVSAGFVGVYDHSVDQGMVRSFAPGWPSGTKFFGPAGLSPSLWTDDRSTYIELWSGATASFWDYATLGPGDSIGWSERWYPVHGLGGFNYANEAAALRLTDTGGGAEVSVAVSSSTAGTVSLWAGGQQMESWPLALAPGQAFGASWTRPPDVGGALGLRLANSSGTVIAQTGQVP